MFYLMVFSGSPIEQSLRFEKDKPYKDKTVKDNPKLTKTSEKFGEWSENKCTQCRACKCPWPSHDAGRDWHN